MFPPIIEAIYPRRDHGELSECGPNHHSAEGAQELYGRGREDLINDSITNKITVTSRISFSI